MYGLEVMNVDGQWVLIDSKELKLTNRLFYRAQKLSMKVRRVAIVNGRRILLDVVN